MSVRTVIADNGTWRFNPDVPPPPEAARHQAILQARIVDEVTGFPPLTPLTTWTTLAGASARPGPGGRVGVVGRPRLIFHDATVATGRADLNVEALGFMPLRLEAPMGPQPVSYPDAFNAPDLGDVALRRQASRISGRVVSRSLGPLAGGAVTLTGVWPLQSGIAAAAAAPNAMPMFLGAYRDRPPGATLRRRNFTLAAQVKRLRRAVVAGDTTLQLSDRQAIAVGDVLAIEPGDPERVEFITVTAINTTSSADQPAVFTLEHGLRREHLDDVECVRAIPGAAGGLNALTRDVRSGDITAWTAGLAGVAAGTTSLEISGGGPPAEFHATQIYTAATGPAGDWRLPPIHRIAHVRLRASHASQPTPSTRVVTLEWGVTEVLVDFLFP